MNENVIDVLLYLFENYIDADNNTQQPDKDTLEIELENVGFPPLEITKAFAWLESMTVVDESSSLDLDPNMMNIRTYTESECEQLTVECRGYLLFLEQVGVLDASTREVVIERVLALDGNEIELDQLKWVVLMVLFYQPGRDVAYAWMEDLVFEDLEAVTH